MTFPHTPPIDQFAQELRDKGVVSQSVIDEGRLQSAVLNAARSTMRAMEWRGKVRGWKKSGSSIANEIKKKLLNAEQEIRDVETFLNTEDGVFFVHQIVDALNEIRPGMEEQNKEVAFGPFWEVQRAADTIRRFCAVVEFGAANVAPPKGRPQGLTRVFIEKLAQEWRGITGREPTRIWDPIEGRETGDFYRFCEAASETIRPLLPIGGIDAAIRAVCNEIRARQSE